MGEQYSVDLIVRAIAEGFDQVASDLAKTGKASTTMSGEMEAASRRVSAAMDLQAQKTEALKKQMEDTASFSTKLAIGFGAIAAGGAALLGGSTLLAARYETLGVVTQVLGKNVGYTTEQMRALEVAVQKQGITMIASRQSIARMIQANIDLAKATELARLAQNAAVIAGINSSDAFEQLVTAISTGQVRLLHTMGIMVTFEDGYKRFAAAAGKTTDALTEEERSQARLNIVLEAGKNITGAYEGAMETAGKKAQSLARHIEDSKVMLGQAWLPVYADAIDLITNSLKAWEGLDQSVKSGISTTLGISTATAGATGATFALFVAVIKLKLGMDALNASMMIGGLGASTFAAAVALPVAALTALAAIAYVNEKAIQANIAGFKEEEKSIRESAASYAEYKKKVEEAAKARNLLIRGTSVAPNAPVGRGGGMQPSVQANVSPDAIQTINEFTNDEIALKKAMIAAVQAARAAAAATQTLSETEQRAIDMQQLGKSVLEALSNSYTYYAEQQDAAAIAAAGLAAGLAGTLQNALDNNKSSLDDLIQRQKDLTDELEEAEKHPKKNAEKIEDLNRALEENAQKQKDVAEATKETIAQMIYQQAAAGLDAQASLDLARRLGVLSEQDYAVATTLQKLHEQYAGTDDVISAAEAQMGYNDAVAQAQQVFMELIAQNIPITLESIAAKTKEIQDRADEAAPSIAGLGGYIEIVGEASINSATKMAAAYDAINDIANAAGTAKTKVDMMRAALDKLHDKTVTLTLRINAPEKWWEVNTGPSGNRQFGGPVDPNKAYMVGEHGRELFVPQTAGYIIPNERLSDGLGISANGRGAFGSGPVIIGGDRVVNINNFNNSRAAAIGAGQLAANRGKRLDRSMG